MSQPPSGRALVTSCNIWQQANALMYWDTVGHRSQWEFGDVLEGNRSKHRLQPLNHWWSRSVGWQTRAAAFPVTLDCLIVETLIGRSWKCTCKQTVWNDLRKQKSLQKELVVWQLTPPPKKNPKFCQIIKSWCNDRFIVFSKNFWVNIFVAVTSFRAKYWRVWMILPITPGPGLQTRSAACHLYYNWLIS